jgi:hypothetical protein
MTEIPIGILYGVEVAIKKLRPNANFQLNNMDFTIWSDPTGSTPPTWEEINEQIEKDKKNHDEYIKNIQPTETST